MDCIISLIHCSGADICGCVDVKMHGQNCLQANSFMEGVSHKIRRQIEELEKVAGVVSSGLTVDGVPVDSYLTRSID